MILLEYLEEHLANTLIEEDLSNLKFAFAEHYGECYTGFAVLEDLMERTIGPRTTFFEVAKAYCCIISILLLKSIVFVI